VPPYAAPADLDRLFSRIHGLEMTVAMLPQGEGVPGEVCEGVERWGACVREETECAVRVAGVRWRREGLVTEIRKMEVVRRMSLGKPGRERVVCSWKE
jgi:hypothetical protein